MTPEVDRSEPVISVITVNYNGAEFLPSLFASTRVLLDEYQSVEHVIIDGASSDRSVSLIEEYCRTVPRARFVSEPDRGIFDAMNKGVRLAKGAYVIHLNGDDYSVGHSVWLRAFSLVESVAPDLIVADVPIVKDGRVHRVLSGRPVNGIHLRFGHHFPHQGTFIKRRLFEEVGLYRTDCGYVSDKLYFYSLIDSVPGLTVSYLDDAVSVQRAGGVSSASILTPFRTLIRMAVFARSGCRYPAVRAFVNSGVKFASRLGLINREALRRYRAVEEHLQAPD